MKSQEISVPMPWGHVAGKAWGDEKNIPILVFHGVLDNAGSFNRLIPLLPQNYYYICFDLPGHGRSSHFPPHLPIHSINYLIPYRIIFKHFGKEKYIIMGHSYGGQIAFKFAQLYPELVEKLIMLDTVHLFPVSTMQFKDYLKGKIDFIVNLQEKLSTGKQPSYTYEEALDKIMQQRHHGNISVEASKSLLERALVPIEGTDKFYFTIDQRLKSFFNPMQDFRYIKDVIKRAPIKCPTLILLGIDSEMQQMYMKSILKLYEQNKLIYIKLVPGHHDVHNNSPETVAPYIKKFLSVKSKL